MHSQLHWGPVHPTVCLPPTPMALSPRTSYLQFICSKQQALKEIWHKLW